MVRRARRNIPFTIVNIDDGTEFSDLIFPQEVERESQAHWKPQPVTGGTMPIVYGNNEPKKLIISSAWLDSGSTNESIRRELTYLESLTQRRRPGGSPPPLLVAYGDDFTFRCVLESVKVKEQHFAPEGFPRRAELSLTFVELQGDERQGQQGQRGQVTNMSTRDAPQSEDNHPAFRPTPWL